MIKDESNLRLEKYVMYYKLVLIKKIYWRDFPDIDIITRF